MSRAPQTATRQLARAQPHGLGLGARLARPDRPLLLFSITPPRRSSPEDELRRIADVTLERLRPLDLDGLIVYDIDDESDRNGDERPFPYLPTVDPAHFEADHLRAWDRPVVVYRSVGKYDAATLARWLAQQDPTRVATVLVGASSSAKQVRTSLAGAQSLWREGGARIPLGGVAIPERHSRTGEEHLRMLRKQEAGCSFFVTQVVYDVDAAKDMASDYRYTCADRGVDPAPLVFTLSVCGSLRTLAFLSWLGVELPRWMRNEIERAEDPLTTSYAQCVATAHELAVFCERLGIPYGFNVESVSIRRAEIEASVRLAGHLRDRLAVLGQHVRAAAATSRTGVPR